jgi:type VII secretion-associated protein (TIGR03931 family)
VRALLTGAGAVLLAVACVWCRPLPAPPGGAGLPAPPGGAGPTVVEGRMAVRIPAEWTVQRVTGGPGARRLQATSPDDPGIALHLTSSYAPEAVLADAADVLARAIAGEPPGVFVDFRAESTVAGRPAVTYRELRPGRVITWVVVQTGSTRISIGCQCPPGRDGAIRAVCDDAVRSAHET